MTKPVSKSASKSLQVAATALTLGFAATLAGCSDNVELNGRLFDMLGVSAASQNAAKREPTMERRAGLVIPPDQTRLPEPGTAPDPKSVLADLADPEQRKALAEEEKARLHKAYCSGEMTWKEEAFDKDHQRRSPFGPCGVISFGNMTKGN